MPLKSRLIKLPSCVVFKHKSNVYFFFSGGMGGLGDLGGMLQNPALMNMATSMMSDPNVQQMMGQLMSGTASQGGNSMDSLLMA